MGPQTWQLTPGSYFENTDPWTPRRRAGLPLIAPNDDWWDAFDSAVWSGVSGGSLVEYLGRERGERVGGRSQTHLSLVSALMQKIKHKKWRRLSIAPGGSVS